MYIHTDDDLTRVNRDFLGPKGKRLPWVAQYRTYGVTIAMFLVMWGLFVFLGVPVNQWTLLLYVFITALITLRITQQMKRDVSIIDNIRAGWQEVTVPRPEKPAEHEHVVLLRIPVRPYDTPPAPRWWEFRKRRAGSETPAPAPVTPITRAERRRARS